MEDDKNTSFLISICSFFYFSLLNHTDDMVTFIIILKIQLNVWFWNMESGGQREVFSSQSIGKVESSSTQCGNISHH